MAQAIVHSGLFYESHLVAWAEGRMPTAALGREPQARLAVAMQEATPAAREAASIELGGVVQRQLDALDGRPLAFTGWAWPGQAEQWQVQREPAHEPQDNAKDPAGGDADPPAWTTQIQLELPRLGALGAHLRLSGTQLSLAVTLGNDVGAELHATHRGPARRRARRRRAWIWRHSRSGKPAPTMAPPDKTDRPSAVALSYRPGEHARQGGGQGLRADGRTHRRASTQRRRVRARLARSG